MLTPQRNNANQRTPVHNQEANDQNLSPLRGRNPNGSGSGSGSNVLKWSTDGNSLSAASRPVPFPPTPSSSQSTPISQMASTIRPRSLAPLTPFSPQERSRQEPSEQLQLAHPSSTLDMFQSARMPPTHSSQASLADYDYPRETVEALRKGLPIRSAPVSLTDAPAPYPSPVARNSTPSTSSSSTKKSDKKSVSPSSSKSRSDSISNSLISQSEIEMVGLAKSDVKSLWNFWKYGSETSKSVDELDAIHGARKWLSSRGRVRYMRYREIVTAIMSIAAEKFEDDFPDSVSEFQTDLDVPMSYIEAAIADLEVQRGGKMLNNLSERLAEQRRGKARKPRLSKTQRAARAAMKGAAAEQKKH